jgi:hypothetical protein
MFSLYNQMCAGKPAVIDVHYLTENCMDFVRILGSDLNRNLFASCRIRDEAERMVGETDTYGRGKGNSCTSGNCGCKRVDNMGYDSSPV